MILAKGWLRATALEEPGGHRKNHWVQARITYKGSPECHTLLPQCTQFHMNGGPTHLLVPAMPRGFERHWKSLYPRLFSMILNEAFFSLSTAKLVWETTNSRMGSSLESSDDAGQ